MSDFEFCLPATSANLGPGFDTLGLAMELWLKVRATAAAEFTIAATGRNAEQVGALERNLLVDTYRGVAPGGPALALEIANEVPLGMGCGSSAAALLAGVLLGNHFGRLGLSDAEIVAEACRREGHPDNVAACFYGGLTVSSMSGGEVRAASFGVGLPWRLVIAVPSASLATEKARQLLPDFYSRAHVVQNIQAIGMMISAFALGRSDILRAGSVDYVHQPYRKEACPLLPLLLPLAGAGGVYSVTLSGAGPSVLLIVDPAADVAALGSRVTGLAAGAGLGAVEILSTTISAGARIGNCY